MPSAIEYVKVDYRDRRPTTEHPARHGPDDPIPGIQRLWAWRDTPTRYIGLAPDDAELDTPGILRVLDDDALAAEVEKRRGQLLDELADHRWRVETGGLTLPDDTRVRTDRESQAQLAGAYQSLTQPFVDEIDWKGPDGWVTVTESELRPIAEAVAQHVQACFKAERRVSEQIAQAEGAEALRDIRVSQLLKSELL